MDFKFDWGEEVSKPNVLSSSQDMNKQSIGDQSSIMPADWTSVMEVMPQRKSQENNIWQLDSNGTSPFDSPSAASPMFFKNSSPTGADSQKYLENELNTNGTTSKLPQQAQDNIMRGLIKLSFLINQHLKFYVYKLRTAKKPDKTSQSSQQTSSCNSNSGNPHANYGGWSKIDTKADQSHHFQSGLFRSDMNIPKIAGRGSIFNEVSRNDALNRSVNACVMRALKDGFQTIRQFSLVKVTPQNSKNSRELKTNKESGEVRLTNPIITSPLDHYTYQPYQPTQNFGTENIMKSANSRPNEVPNYDLGSMKVQSMRQFPPMREQPNKASIQVDLPRTHNHLSNPQFQMNQASRSMGNLPIPTRPVSQNPYVKLPINSQNLITGWRMNAPYIDKMHTARFSGPISQPSFLPNSLKQTYSQGLLLTLKQNNGIYTNQRPSQPYLMPQNIGMPPQRTQRPFSMNNPTYQGPFVGSPRQIHIPTTVGPPVIRDLSPQRGLPHARNLSPPNRPLPIVMATPKQLNTQAMAQYGFIPEGTRSPKAGISLMSKNKFTATGRRN